MRAAAVSPELTGAEVLKKKATYLKNGHFPNIGMEVLHRRCSSPSKS